MYYTHKVKIADVLKAKHTLRWVAPTISQESTIQEAISVAIERGLSGMMVVDREEKLERSREKGKVVGMTTSRDLLRVMHKDFRDGKDPQEVMDTRVKSFMVSVSQQTFNFKKRNFLNYFFFLKTSTLILFFFFRIL